MRNSFLIISVLAFLISCKESKKAQDNSSKKNYAEFNSKSSKYATNVYFGDTHLHTELSMDAGAFGNRIGLDEAYKLSKGEEVTSSSGLTAKLSRPLVRVLFPRLKKLQQICWSFFIC